MRVARLPSAVVEPVDRYLAARGRILDLLAAHPDREAVPVPGTPGWTVHDVVAHLAGLVSDANAGRLEGAGSPPWTAAQIEARRDTALADVLAEWERELPPFVAAMQERPTLAFVFDVLVHEHDLRGALGLQGPGDPDAVDWSLQPLVGRLGSRLEKDGGPAVRIVSGDTEWTLGPGEPAATVEVPRFELFRAVFGRRSAAQVRGWPWDGDPTPYLEHLNVFGLLPAEDVVEG